MLTLGCIVSEGDFQFYFCFLFFIMELFVCRRLRPVFTPCQTTVNFDECLLCPKLAADPVFKMVAQKCNNKTKLMNTRRIGYFRCLSRCGSWQLTSKRMSIFFNICMAGAALRDTGRAKLYWPVVSDGPGNGSHWTVRGGQVANRLESG